MQNTSAIDRRNFLKLSGFTGAALIIGFSSKGKEIAAAGDINEAYKLTPYIIIEKSGKITIMNPRPEMGQGTYQSVPALIAEELQVALGVRTTHRERNHVIELKERVAPALDASTLVSLPHT